MTRYFTEDGVNIPITVVQAGPCFVTQIKKIDAEGYAAIQIGFEDIDPKGSTFPVIGHDAKAGVSVKRTHREYRYETDKEAEAFELGQEITVSDFDDIMYVDVIATSKGKGFQGGMKRHGFKGQLASHGVERKHRSPGAISGHATNLGTGPKLKKGKKMAGQMGNVRHTVRNLDVVKVDHERGLLLLKGGIPGPNGGLLYVRTSRRLGRQKQLKLSDASK